MTVYDVGDVGDVATLDFTLRLDNVLTDATVTLTVTAPDGTVTTPTPSHGSTGTYSYDLQVTDAGRWLYAWSATGAAEATEFGSLWGLSAGDRRLHSETKARLNKTVSVDDDELQDMLERALAEYAEFVGPLPGEVTETVDGGGTSAVLSSPNVTALTEASYTDGTTITLADLEVKHGIVYWGYGTAGRFAYGSRNVTLTYMVGELPANHRETIIADVAGYFEATQRSSTDARFPGEGFDEAPYASTPLVLFPRIRALAPPRVG